jgi:NAD-dependent DNA ligase
MGIAAGLIADRALSDAEIRYLQTWLSQNEDMATCWPGDVLYDRVQAVLADGIITDEERVHLVDTLTKLCGGELEVPGGTGAVNQMIFDQQAIVSFVGLSFCATGEFIYGPRTRVHDAIAARGGIVQKGITKKLRYLIVGLRGSDEWKHGSYGSKIMKAVEYRRAGVPLTIVSEDRWSAALKP